MSEFVKIATDLADTAHLKGEENGFRLLAAYIGHLEETIKELKSEIAALRKPAPVVNVQPSVQPPSILPPGIWPNRPDDWRLGDVRPTCAGTTCNDTVPNLS